MREGGREVSERKGGGRKINQVNSKKRKALSKLEGKKILQNLTGRKKGAGNSSSTRRSLALELSYYSHFLDCH